MGVRILSDGDNAVLYCSTEMKAFGPVFSRSDMGSEEHDAQGFCYDAETNVERFLDWLQVDPRPLFNSGELFDKYNEWLRLTYFSKFDLDHDASVPDDLTTAAYERMAEHPIASDDMCDREEEFVQRILEDDHWYYQPKVQA